MQQSTGLNLVSLSRKPVLSRLKVIKVFRLGGAPPVSSPLTTLPNPRTEGSAPSRPWIDPRLVLLNLLPPARQEALWEGCKRQDPQSRVGKTAVLEASVLCLWRGKEGKCSTTTTTNSTGPKMHNTEAFSLPFRWSAGGHPAAHLVWFGGSGQESAPVTSSLDC